MLVLFGDSALSAFRVDSFLDQCRLNTLPVTGVSTRYVYLVDQSASKNSTGGADAKEQLCDLLGARPESSWVPDLLVTPRFGTISPWASKATNIAHNCGMLNIRRIERAVAWQFEGEAIDLADPALMAIIHDRMTETVLKDTQLAGKLFAESAPSPLRHIDILSGGEQQLAADNRRYGFALSDDEIEYLVQNYRALGRNPTDAELMMFAQANSEHCRHKIFNASWVVDGVAADLSLFAMIRNTHKQQPYGTLVAYDDNAAVIEGSVGQRFMPDSVTGVYTHTREAINIQIKVETHNHPTAISPFPGAATGAGGEIRDEGATGNGSRPKAGMCGFSVSNLRIPGFTHEWEQHPGKPDHIASALQIMIEGPIGAAAFNNEFGRPNLTGYFRTFEMQVPGTSDGQWRGYHKPVMIAGGLGNIRPCNTLKKPVPAGSRIVVLGGPAMLIGLGGGAASSMASGESDESLDFASVQRGNPEMERRCQEVINTCIALGDNSPVLSLHDVGAGGLSNALPELVHDAGRGARFDLRRILSDEAGMSPMEIWCNESQERYVLAIAEAQLQQFEAICARERCPMAVVGEATAEQHLLLQDEATNEYPVDMSLDLLLGKPPRMQREVLRQPFCEQPLKFQTAGLRNSGLAQMLDRVLTAPCVAAKSFLITIGDRSVGGLVHRDQMVGPHQIPVADAAVTLTAFTGYAGEAMAIGEKSPLALINPQASGRMAVAESLTNIMSVAIGDIHRIKLSANWMAAAGHEGEDAALFDTVAAVAQEFCPALGLSIPVGKDSLSMKSVWANCESGEEQSVTAPLSLVVTAFAPVADIRLTRTPQLRADLDDTVLVLADIGLRKNRLGGSVLAQVNGQVGNECPDIDDVDVLAGVYRSVQELLADELIVACHDRSDGGLIVTVAEMCFAGNCGAELSLDCETDEVPGCLFAEESGVVLQIERRSVEQLEAVFTRNSVRHCVRQIGKPSPSRSLLVTRNGETLLDASVDALRKKWWETSYQMQALRDNPDSAAEEFAHIGATDDPGITVELTFDPADNVVAKTGTRPRVAVLRDQGVNGHVEMAAAFDRAGFESVDVHMTDIISGGRQLSGFNGLVACGGFSYGDVLGAGGGWAQTIRHNPAAADQFGEFFTRNDVFVLGVCNGCQMFSCLRDMIPGAQHWPSFERNRSEQFEARFCTVLVEDSPSILLKDMQGSRIPVVVSHGEGRAEFDEGPAGSNVTLRYVDNHGKVTGSYPLNPNGSPQGVTGFCSDDGRFNIMMPHPERVFRTVQNSWYPTPHGEDGPWLRMFRNARDWASKS